MIVHTGLNVHESGINPSLCISRLVYLGPRRFQIVLPSLFALQFGMTVRTPSRDTTQSGPCWRTYSIFIILFDGLDGTRTRSLLVANETLYVEATSPMQNILYLTDKNIDIIKGGGDIKKKMKMELMPILILIVLGTLIGSAAATACVEVTTSVQVIGEGAIDSVIEMQSSNSPEGLKYYGEAYTPALGMFGPSTIILSSEYMLTRNNASEMQISEESEIENVRCKRCFKNYDLGTLQVFNTFGDYSVLAEFGGDVNISMMMVEAKISGEAISEMTVRDLNASHFYVVRDQTKYKGDFKEIVISNLVERVEEPRADSDDWLGCP